MSRTVARMEQADKPPPSPIGMWFGSWDAFVDGAYAAVKKQVSYFVNQRQSFMRETAQGAAMEGIFDTFPVILTVWMIGFSLDSRKLRMGGFVILTIKWLVPFVLLAVVGSLAALEMLRYDFFVRLVLSLMFGAYLLLWSMRSTQTWPIRVALAVAGLISLKFAYVIGLMSIASLWTPVAQH